MNRDMLVNLLKAQLITWHGQLAVARNEGERIELTVLIEKVTRFLKDEFNA